MSKFQSSGAESRARSCYLFGYSGKGNTGSDARLVCIVEQLLEALGEETRITVATFDVDASRRVLRRFPRVRFSRITPLAALPVMWQLATNDVTVLVEGSTFKQNFSGTLLRVFLFVAWFSRLMGRRSVAYAVDAGVLSPFHARLTRPVAEKMDLLITRTEQARQQLATIGVKREIKVGTDPAFRFQCPILPTGGSERRTLGIAPIEFYQWPTRYRLWGPRAEKYHWPHYFSWDDRRRKLSEQTIAAWAGLIEHAQHQHQLDIKLIAMEALDERVCRQILDRLSTVAQQRVSLISSVELPPDELVPNLRSLDFLATSRYHACVLSMHGNVPQMAVGHDERLVSIYHELGLADKLLLNESEVLEPGRLNAMLDQLVAEKQSVRSVIAERHENWFLPRCDANVDTLRAAASDWGWTVKRTLVAAP